MVLNPVRYSFSQRLSVPADEAFRWSLDYDPDDAYQLTAPRTMAELLAREHATRNAAIRQAAGYDPDVMVLNGFDPWEAVAFQRGLDRGGHRR